MSLMLPSAHCFDLPEMTRNVESTEKERDEEPHDKNRHSNTKQSLKLTSLEKVTHSFCQT